MLTSFCEKSTQELACYFNNAGKVTRMWDRITKGGRHCYLVLSQEGWTKGSERHGPALQWSLGMFGQVWTAGKSLCALPREKGESRTAQTGGRKDSRCGDQVVKPERGRHHPAQELRPRQTICPAASAMCPHTSPLGLSLEGKGELWK